MGEVWTRWEGQVVNGAYPLRRFLNASDHSAVFLTESAIEGFFNAAIKLIPAEPGVATDVQLWQWKTAATITHPHLMRLLDSGQWEVEGRRLLFVVMEYAEETLAQVLPYRALVSDEVRELLVPTLDALAFLHRESWIQGQMKPTNFLVVNDQLKLAIDTIRPVGVARGAVVSLTPYDAPEFARGESTPAADVWGLAVTLVEALTQCPPTWPDGRSEPPVLRASVPSSFEDIIQQCLSVDPADRPTVAELQGRTRPGAAAQQVASTDVAASRVATAGATATAGADVAASRTTAAGAMASGAAASGGTAAGTRTAGGAASGAGTAGADVAASRTTAAGAMASGAAAAGAARSGAAVMGATDAEAALMDAPVPHADADRSSVSVRATDRPQATAYAPSGAGASRGDATPVSRGTAAGADREAIGSAPGRAAGSDSMRAGDSFSRPSSYSYSQESEGDKRRLIAPAIAAVVVILLAIWGGTRLFHTEPETPVPPPVSHAAPNTSVGPSETNTAPSESPTSATAPTATPPTAAPAPSAAKPPSDAKLPHATPSPPATAANLPKRPPPPAATPHTDRQAPQVAANGTANVVHEEIPKVSLSSRQTIRGHVRVAVRVTVDKSGKVVRDTFDNASSSKYFNRVASEAARKWRFTSADNEGAREWLLNFEFGREGTTVRATRPRSFQH